MFWRSVCILEKGVGYIHYTCHHSDYVFLALWSCNITMCCLGNWSLTVSIFLSDWRIIIKKWAPMAFGTNPPWIKIAKAQRSPESSSYHSAFATLLSCLQHVQHMKHFQRWRNEMAAYKKYQNSWSSLTHCHGERRALNSSWRISDFTLLHLPSCMSLTLVLYHIVPQDYAVLKPVPGSICRNLLLFL